MFLARMAQVMTELWTDGSALQAEQATTPPQALSSLFTPTPLPDAALMSPQLRAAGKHWLTFVLSFGSPGGLVKGGFPKCNLLQKLPL